VQKSLNCYIDSSNQNSLVSTYLDLYLEDILLNSLVKSKLIIMNLEFETHDIEKYIYKFKSNVEPHVANNSSDSEHKATQYQCEGKIKLKEFRIILLYL